MACSCNSYTTAPNSSGSIQSWYDLQDYAPRNPLDLIWLAQIYDGANTDIGKSINGITGNRCLR